jgi:D-amino-acid dehydrogenase
VNQCFPGVSTRRVEPWAGLRPMMPNMMPRVGAGSRPNVFYNTGHGHLGWTLSAITAHQLGEHVAQWERMRTPMLVPVVATVQLMRSAACQRLLATTERSKQ